MSSNSEVIIIKIKDLFKKKYSYRKQELINELQKSKMYPEEQIYAGLQFLIDKNEKIVDKIGRVGVLKNVDDIYSFHLEELSDKAKLTSYEIKKPNNIKPNKLNIKLDNTITKTVIEDESLFELIDDLRYKFYLIKSNKYNNNNDIVTMRYMIKFVTEYNFKPFKEQICKMK